jgi:hypothetical protein
MAGHRHGWGNVRAAFVLAATCACAAAAWAWGVPADLGVTKELATGVIALVGFGLTILAGRNRCPHCDAG